MAKYRPFGIIDFLLLLSVFAGAAALRAGYLVRYADSGDTPGPIRVQDPPPPPGQLATSPKLEAREKEERADESLLGQHRPTELDSLVSHLKESNWFGTRAPFSEEAEQTADYSPGYPWLLAWLARVVDAGSLARTVRWIQVGLGALTSAVYYLFTLRAFSSRLVAVLAGAFTALYPFWIVSVAEINDAVLSSLLLALSLYLGTRAIQTTGPFASLLYGLALAGLALVRAAALPFGFLALGWFLLRSRHEARGWLCALLAFLGFVNGLAPWTVRNYHVFGEPVPIVSTAWLHLWIGNNEHATGGPAKEPMTASAPADELRTNPNQVRRYARLGSLVWDEIQHRPIQTVQRRIWAGLDFLWGERFFTAGRLVDPTLPDEDVHEWELPLELSLISLYLLAFLGWRWTYGWRRECMPATLAVLWLPLPYLLSHAEALHGARLPLDGVLLCYAAFALTCLVPGIGGTLREASPSRLEGEPHAS